MTKNAVLTGVVVVAVVAIGGSAALAHGKNGKWQNQNTSFSEIDANGDGNLTLEEFRTMRDSQFAAHDANGDGSLDLDEFHAAWRNRTEQMLRRLDANEDGVLTSDEMPKPRISERIFNRMDADSDGMITQEEFESARRENNGRFWKRGRKDRHRPW